MLRGKEILDAIKSREVRVCLVSIVLQCLKADFFTCEISIVIS